MASQITDKVQPWKKHWPPVEDNKLQGASTKSDDEPSHGCPKGAVLISPGDTIGKPKTKVQETTTTNNNTSQNIW